MFFVNGWTVPLVPHILGNQYNSPEHKFSNDLVVISKNCPPWTLNETLVRVTSPDFDKITLKLNLLKCAFGYFFINSSFNFFLSP